ncbi:MAG: carbonic anhydrase [Alphaproteobacteria bacterium]
MLPGGFHRDIGCGGCGCGTGTAGRVDRRFLLRATGAGMLLAAAPSLVRAQGGKYEAMILACIDPRTQEPVHVYAAERGLTGKYSQFVVAGAAVGVVAPKFADWHKTFWDNLAASIQLHQIGKVIAIDHRDCGAARIAYGEAALADPARETETHRKALAQFRREVGQRHPKLGVETGLMALDGSIEMFG